MRVNLLLTKAKTDSRPKVTRPNTSRFEFFKWSAVVLLIIVGIIANQYYAKLALPLRLIGWLILACVVLAIAAKTNTGKKLLIFAREAQIELRKVVWPTRQETIHTTVIVIGMVAVVAMILWGVDAFLLWAVGLLTGQRG